MEVTAAELMFEQPVVGQRSFWTFVHLLEALDLRDPARRTWGLGTPMRDSCHLWQLPQAGTEADRSLFFGQDWLLRRYRPLQPAAGSSKQPSFNSRPFAWLLNVDMAAPAYAIATMSASTCV